MKKIFSCFSVLSLALAFVSCSSDVDELAKNEVGYLKLGIETNSATVTRSDAPANYDPRNLYVEVTPYGLTVPVVRGLYSNLAGKTHELTAGTYIITAYSNGWDGSGSGIDAPYYYGSTEKEVKAKTIVTASVVCTQANVKVVVEYSDDFKQSFSEAQTTLASSLSGVGAIVYSMNEKKGAAYLPAAEFTATLDVNGHSLPTRITDVQPRDFYRLVYKMAEEGTLSDINVVVDETGKEYTYNILVPKKAGTSLAAYKANAWSNMAYLEGAVTTKKSGFDKTKVSMQWKLASAPDDAWATIDNTLLSVSDDTYKYQLKGLTPNTTYQYRLIYVSAEDNVQSEVSEFTTEGQTALYNGGFENWYSQGRIDICGSTSDGKYWNSSNAGAATYIGSVTTQETSFKHGGNSSAKLATQWAVVKLAAASLFTGDFIGLIGTKGAKLDWGVPFTSRPTALKGYYSYTPGPINRGSQPSGVGAPAKDSNDECQVFCALVTELFHVANAEAQGYQMTTNIDWQNDPRVVAYGQMTKNSSSNGGWQELNIPLEYHSLTTQPTHLIIVCSASKWGDYFYGSDSSVLYLDDFELVYGDTPTVKQ